MIKSLQYLEMEFSHLDEAFFEKILRRSFKNENNHLIQIEKSLATGEGDNFFSDIYRIFLRYTKDTKNKSMKREEVLSLIVKVETSRIKKEAIHGMFTTELKVLQNVLPRIEQFLECSLGPRLIFGDENTNFIVMEDLASKGFIMQNRQKGLSLAQCLIAIEKLAKFHAGTVALTEKVMNK